jgi:hypothetical protein
MERSARLALGRNDFEILLINPFGWETTFLRCHGTYIATQPHPNDLFCTYERRRYRC